MPNISELKKAGITGSFWNFLTTIISQLRGIIVSIILARILTPNDFGIIAIALVFNGILETLIDFGFGNALVQKKDISEVEKSTIFYINIIIGLLFTIILFFCAPFMANYFQMPLLNNVIKVTSFSFFIGSFSIVQTALFQREIEFKPIFHARWISSVVSGVLGIIFAIYDYGVWSLVISNIVSWLLNTIIIWVLSDWKPSIMFDLRKVTSLWSFGWKLTVSTLINRLFVQIDTFIIGKLYSPASLGLYNRAQSLNRLIVDYTFSSLRPALLPTFSKLQDDNQQFKQSVIKLINVICCLNFFFSGLMYICSDDIIHIIYGNKWDEAIPMFKILSIFSLHLSLPVLYDTVMNSLAKMNMYFWINLIRKPFLIAAIPIGIHFGFYGYIWSINIAYLLSIIPYLWSTEKCCSLSIQKQLKNISIYTIPFILGIIIYHTATYNFKFAFIGLILKVLIYLIIYVGYCEICKCEGYQIIKSTIMAIKHRNG